MAENTFILGFLYGIVPALGFLYILLRPYYGFFQEKRVFSTFFVGIIAGVIGTVLGLSFFGTALFDFTGNWKGYAFFVANSGLLGLLQAMMFAAVLNWKSFRGRRDTPYYGLAFGLGYGASSVLFLMGGFLSLVFDQDVSVEVLVLITLFGLHFCGVILIAGATGVYIGHGSGTGPLPRYILRGALLAAAPVLVLYGIYAAVKIGGIATVWLLLSTLAVLALGIWSVFHASRTVLDKVVPPEVLREMDLHNRRIARAAGKKEEG